MKTFFLILVASMGCAGIARLPGATTRSAAPEDRIVRGTAASAAISPTLRSTAHEDAVLATSTLRPGEWSRARWMTLLTDVLSNGKLAHAAAWIAGQPLYVRVSEGGFSVAIRMPTP